MRLVRWLHPEAIWFVTNRTEQEQLLLLPSKRINELIGGWLARALEARGDGIELFGFIFLSNHFHLLLRDTKGQLAAFMWYFETNLAKEVNRELMRHGHVFARRYDAELVDGEEEFMERYAYVLGNAVKAGLVERASQWPGLSSLGAALSGEPLRFTVFDRTGHHNATRRGQEVDRSRFCAELTVRIEPPPMWSGHPRRMRTGLILELLRCFELEQRRLRRAEKKGFLGMRGILAQRPTDRPLESSFAPRVFVLCADGSRREELLASWKAVTGEYRERFAGYREAAVWGRRRVSAWPMWTCPPSCVEPVGYEAAA